MDTSELNELFRSIDRAFFIDGEFKQYAGLDRPLPIGHGQTISQPTLVLNMTALLMLDKSCRVLEIGTGSGYQTAFLAALAGEVYTVERLPELAQAAQSKLNALGFENIDFLVGDGSEGWPQHAPYDRIITTAAAGRLPEKLLEQLKPGGIAIAPVGPKGVQDLMRITKDGGGKLAAEPLGQVAFVELVGQYGWKD